MLLLRRIAVAIGISLALCAPAQSALIEALFQGRILSGTATTSYFTGTAGDDLSTFGDGLITGRFVYDSEFAGDGAGTFEGLGVNWISFQVTMAGTSYNFGSVPTALGVQSISIANGSDSFNLQYLHDGAAGTEFVNLDLSGEEFLDGIYLPTSFNYSGLGGGFGSLVIQNGAVEADAFFSITGVQAVPFVPEPATWLFFIVGFGIVGGVLRRKLRGQVPLAA